jgi:endonuclease/exonuclease/phosphatase family metal-dependent hydrolase
MNPRLLVALSALLAAALGLVAGGCSAPPPSGASADAPGPDAFPLPADGEFSVMTFNLHRYGLQDRDDGTPPAPRPEADALVDVIRQAAPHVLAVQEMGDPAAWADFKYRLRQAGLDYRFEEYLRRDPLDVNLAVLSQYPIVARQPRTNDLYTIGPTQFPVQRGFLEVDIEVTPAYRFRLLVAHLKSKVFHEYGQAEMRRNEARLLGNHVRAALNENPQVNLVVAGDFNDTPESRPLREIHTYQGEPILLDLRPADSAGDAWTARTDDDNHQRSDYILVNAGMLNEVQIGKTYVARTLGLQNATDHRPLVATFVAHERGPESAPDLSARRPPVFPPSP